ncbi:hypothetical protein F5883DRAFT_639509 [Diaporthe sp. PMI_573]|nr:hypothetical protein F5883DRAFT_639509 [Diaporthaceae sp. PMI_573]
MPSSHEKPEPSSAGGTLKGPKYSHKVGFQDLYKGLNKNSVEANVDEIWTYILRRYFANDDRSDDDYSIAVQQRVVDEEGETADLIIKTVRNDAFQKIIFIEDKRASGGADKGEPLYGVVTVGRYSRFYCMAEKSTTLDDMAEFQGRYFEFLADEDEIDYILMLLKAKTK